MFKSMPTNKVVNIRQYILGSKAEPALKRQYLLAMEIAKRVKRQKGEALLVGGAVRDACLRRLGKDLVIKDLDLEIFGMQTAELRTLLIKLVEDSMIRHRLNLKQIPLNEVGRQFGVFNILGLDIALPRIESRTKPGMGRKPQIVSQSNLDFRQAAARRDLTINALALDLKNGRILDAYGGLEDLRKGVLRAVDHQSFGDDPLRVLRVMQFAARFGFVIHPSTVSLCRSIKLNLLAKERVGQEWHKMLIWSRQPSIGLQAAYKLGVLDKLNPGLAKLFKQGKQYSARLGKSLDYAADKSSEFKLSENKRKLLLLTILTHALGQREAVLFLKQINASGVETKVCMSLLKSLTWLYKFVGKSQKLDLKYLVKKIAFDLSCANTSLVLFDFIIILEALSVLDKKKQEIGPYMIKDFKSEASSLMILLKPPVAILSGRDLLALGVDPGPGMGQLLKRAIDAQFKGVFDDARGRPSKSLAIKWIGIKH